MSKYWTVTTQQWVKGFFLAVIGAALTIIFSAAVSALQNHGAIMIDWGLVSIASLVAGLSYIMHALGIDVGTNSPTAGKFLGKF